MDRLVASDRQLLVLGQYLDKKQATSKHPLYKALHVINLGPGELYLSALTLASESGADQVKLRLSERIEHGYFTTLFTGDVKLFAKQVEGTDKQTSFWNHVHAKPCLMGCEALSFQGTHSPRWLAEIYAREERLRLPDVP